MMRVVFFIGTAGSGKSSLTAAFAEWLRLSKQDVSIINLDPGALTLPYTPDVDVRDYVNVEELMEEYSLGPNGALVMAADLIADEIEKISRDVEELKSDIVLVDTPGQMELFAFRASGPYIVHEFTKEPKAAVYLFDAVFSLNPLNYVSNVFLSAAVYTRFFIPQVHVLSKCDLLPTDDVNRIVDWSANPKSLEYAIDQKLEGTKRLLSRNMMKAIFQLGLRFLLIPVSARTNDGMINFNMALERILAGCDKYTY
ncbi:MAG: ATP/GTP-binding protein [Candidatus Bathyarchaeota archaeon]|nr:ATP/GTP-binding protein [Candidatus Bathyarchaeota archaeon]